MTQAAFSKLGDKNPCPGLPLNFTDKELEIDKLGNSQKKSRDKKLEFRGVLSLANSDSGHIACLRLPLTIY